VFNTLTLPSKMKEAGSPEDGEPEVKFVVLVPFRDEPSQNRRAHYETFLSYMPDVLNRLHGAGRWAIMVGEQTVDGRRFSRARVLNAVALIASAMFPGATLIFHDIDLLPDETRVALYGRPIPPPYHITLLNCDPEYAGCDMYIGGICAIHASTFLHSTVNGFPNGFIGWGGEDDALRNLVFRFAGRKKDVIYVPAGGSVRNLETDPAFVKPEHIRAKNNDGCKMPREDRHALKDSCARHGNDDGVAELVFGVAGITDLGQDRCYMRVVRLELFVELPPSWSCAMSKTRCRPYYSNPAVTPGIWEYPSGTKVSRHDVVWTAP